MFWTAPADIDPIGFLPIDPKPAHSQRRDDMGRKVGMTCLLKPVDTKRIKTPRLGLPKLNRAGRGGLAAERGSASKGWLNA